MQLTPSNDNSLAPSDARFLTRLSIALTIVVFGLGVLTIVSLVTDFRGFEVGAVPGVRSKADVVILERLNVAGLIFTLVFWSFLFIAVLAFWRRRPWSRWVAFVLLALGIFFGISWSAVSVIGALGSGPPGEWTDMFLALFRVAMVALGIGALALAYLCWRVIKRLMSSAIARAFSYESLHHGA